MVTPEQLAANRKNAKLSTGPRTPAGKQRSSLNAIRHGLTGQVRITTPEDQAAYEKHCRGFFEDLRPRGSAEKHLVQIIADKQWLVHHASSLLESIQVLGHMEVQGRIQAGDTGTHGNEVPAALTAGLVAIDPQKVRQLDLISRYSSRLQRNGYKALKDLEVMQEARRKRE